MRVSLTHGALLAALALFSGPPRGGWTDTVNAVGAALARQWPWGSAASLLSRTVDDRTYRYPTREWSRRVRTAGVLDLG